MSYIKLSHLDTSFPDYDFVWNLVDSIITADPSSAVRLLVCRSSVTSQHVFNAIKKYKYNKHYFIDIECSLDSDDRERLEIVITKNFEVIE